MFHSALPLLIVPSASVNHWDTVTPALEGPAHSGTTHPLQSWLSVPFHQHYLLLLSDQSRSPQVLEGHPEQRARSVRQHCLSRLHSSPGKNMPQFWPLNSARSVEMSCLDSLQPHRKTCPPMLSETPCVLIQGTPWIYFSAICFILSLISPLFWCYLSSLLFPW